MSDNEIANNLAELIMSQKWVAVAALVTGFITRLLKSDTKIPINIPTRARPPLALGLGVIAGVLDKLASGQPWPAAIVGGLVAGVLAMAGHDLVIESARGGREIAIPGLMVAGASPAPGKPPTIPPAPLAPTDHAPPPVVLPPLEGGDDGEA